jgi:hypothetical protein
MKSHTKNLNMGDIRFLIKQITKLRVVTSTFVIILITFIREKTLHIDVRMFTCTHTVYLFFFL